MTNPDQNTGTPAGGSDDNPNQQSPKWTKEPWPDYSNSLPKTLSAIDYKRAQVCVNALSGIEDPEEWIESMRELLENIKLLSDYFGNDLVLQHINEDVEECLELLPTPQSPEKGGDCDG